MFIDTYDHGLTVSIAVQRLKIMLRCGGLLNILQLYSYCMT